MPSAGDFRVDINEEAKAEIIANCNKAHQDRLENAMKDAWDRLKDCLERMSDRLTVDVKTDDDGNPSHEFRVFRDSLMENAVEMVDMLQHLNITKNPDMERARLSLKSAISNHDLDDLRSSMTARNAVKTQVDAILSKFNF